MIRKLKNPVPLVGGLLTILAFLALIYNAFVIKSIEKLISTTFNNNYETEIFEMSTKPYGVQSILVFGHDKRYHDYCPRITRKEHLEGDLELPQIKIFEKRDNVIIRSLGILNYKEIFSFKVDLIENEDHWGGRDLFIKDKIVEDLDGDGIKEIIVNVMTTTCGSGSDLYQFVFSYDRTIQNYELTETWPDIAIFEELGPNYSSNLDRHKVFSQAFENGWIPKPLFPTREVLVNDERFVARITNIDTFMTYKDLDEDNLKELIIGIPIWNDKERDAGECHWCKHFWMIGVYKYKDGTFNVDNKFNDSLLFITRDKYDFYEILGYKPYPNNYYGVVSQYYGLGLFDIESQYLDFEFIERKTSKIYDIIKMNYR